LGIMPSFRSNLYHRNENDSSVLLDGVMALFDSSFSKSVDDGDVAKSANPKEMISLVRDSKTLALERRPAPTSDDTLFLRLAKTTQRKYRLEFEPAGLDPLLTAFLDDSYTNTKTEISTGSNTFFDFEINGEAASADANRFRVVFKIAKVLPVTYRSISAKQQGEDIAVSWTVENEINIKRYEVEKSENGIDFKKVNITPAAGAGRGTVGYEWLDENPLAGNNYYRVRSIGANGKSDYSKTVVVKMANVFSAIDVFPNPVVNDIIGISFKNMAAGVYEMKLVNVLGQTLFTKQVNHLAGTSMEHLQPGNLVAGVYEMIINKPDQTVTTVKVIVQ